MSTTTTDRPAVKPRRPKTTGGPNLGKGRSPEAKRLAAAILEVLAGTRTPTEAAVALELSVPRYYQVESAALGGLLAACEPRPKGRQANPASELLALRRENQRLQRDVTRQQSLARTAQRAIGLHPPPATPLTKNGKRKRKQRVARALSVAQRLQADNVLVATTTEKPLAPSTPGERGV